MVQSIYAWKKADEYIKDKKRYERIKMMQSVGVWTKDKYPTFSAWRRALREGRVCGNYDKKVIITSNNLNKQYTFVLRNFKRLSQSYW